MEIPTSSAERQPSAATQIIITSMTAVMIEFWSCPS